MLGDTLIDAAGKTTPTSSLASCEAVGAPLRPTPHARAAAPRGSRALDSLFLLPPLSSYRVERGEVPAVGGGRGVRTCARCLPYNYLVRRRARTTNPPSPSRGALRYLLLCALV